MPDNPAPYTTQTTLQALVNALDGKDRNKPEVEYEFSGNRKFTVPQNFNPYTGQTE
jgi:hypothetical protein